MSVIDKQAGRVIIGFCLFLSGTAGLVIVTQFQFGGVMMKLLFAAWVFIGLMVFLISGMKYTDLVDRYG